MKIKSIKNKVILTSFTTLLTTYLMIVPVLASDSEAKQVQGKVTSVANTFQNVLSSIIVVVGICVSLFIIIKRMPEADDPREKSEVYHAIGRVASMVALSAALVWILPWIYSLFQ